MDETTGAQEPTNLAGEETPLENLEGDKSPKKDLSPTEELQTAKGQKAHFQEKSQKLEEKVKTLEEKLAEKGEVKEDEPAEKTPEQSDESKVVLDAREYARLLNEGYSDKEIGFVERTAQAEKKTVKEVLEDEFVKAAIEKTRSDSKSEQVTPPPSSKVSRLETLTGKPLKDMTPEEREEGLSFEAWKAKKKKGG